MRPSFALALLSVVLVSSAAAKSKAKNAKSKPKNMSVWMMSVEGCDALVDVEQEPNPFLTNVTELEEKGAVKFRGDSGTLENYPDEVTLTIHYRRVNTGGFGTTASTKLPGVCEPIDPSRVNFRATWSNKSRTLAADGLVLKQEDLGPEAFCELQCSDWWVFQLRIESKDVPLTDNLTILADSPDGGHLVKLVGGLGPLEHVVNPIN